MLNNKNLIINQGIKINYIDNKKRFLCPGKETVFNTILVMQS